MAWTSVAPELRVSEDHAEGTAQVRLAGELDLATGPLARRVLLDAAARSRVVVLDLAWVTFLDAFAIGCLLEAWRSVSAHGGELNVRRVHPAVRRVVELTGLAGPLGVAIEDDSGSAPTVDVVAVLEETIDEALRLTGADMANAQLLDTASRSLRIVAQHGFSRRFLDFFEVVDGAESACGKALADHRPVWVSDVSRSGIFVGTPALEAMLDADARAVASIPVEMPSGELVAMFSVHSRRVTHWTAQLCLALQGIGSVAGRKLAII